LNSPFYQIIATKNVNKSSRQTHKVNQLYLSADFPIYWFHFKTKQWMEKKQRDFH